ncbi:MAG: DUF4375 domain-containing protein [Steroidobacteraceae bacterium]
MPDLKWLDGYSGESVHDLIALSAIHRVDSIVLAIEQALQQRAEDVGLSALNEAEVTVLAVEALEREVNNGGYHQFFLNTPEFAPFLVESLKRIACHKTAEISAKAISLLRLRHSFTADQVQDAIDNDLQETLIEALSDQCDGPYHGTGEPIADQLFEYVRANHTSIHLA